MSGLFLFSTRAACSPCWRRYCTALQERCSLMEARRLARARISNGSYSSQRFHPLATGVRPSLAIGGTFCDRHRLLWRQHVRIPPPSADTPQVGSAPQVQACFGFDAGQRKICSYARDEHRRSWPLCMLTIGSRFNLSLKNGSALLQEGALSAPLDVSY
jgi:hypothetical protein